MRSREVGAAKFALTSFLSLFSCTVYMSSLVTVLLNEPNPKWAAYSPNVHLTNIFTIAQALLQLYWLAVLVQTVGKRNPLSEQPHLPALDEETEYLDDSDPAAFYPESSQFTYAPFYIVGNFLLATWGALWIRGIFIPSLLCLVFNALVQLTSFLVMPRGSRSKKLTGDVYATHALGKTCTGLTILLLSKTLGTIALDTAPSMAQLILGGVVLLLFTHITGPDPTLPFCILYDLISLLVGQTKLKVYETAFTIYFGLIALVIIIEHAILLWQWIGNTIERFRSLVWGKKGRKLCRGITTPTPGSRRFTDDDDDEEFAMLPFQLRTPTPSHASDYQNEEN